MTARKILLWLTGCLSALLCAGIIAANLWLQSYLQSQKFLDLVSEAASSSFSAEGKFSPLRWTGWSVYSDGFSAVGRGSSALHEINAQRIRTDFRWRAVFSGVWKLENTSVGFLQISLQPKVPGASSAPLPPVPADALPSSGASSAGLPGFLPSRFDAGETSIDSANLLFPGGALKNVSAKVSAEGGDWLVGAKGGQLLWAFLPENEIQFLQARWNNAEKTLYLINSTLNFQKGGTLGADGSFSPKKDSMLLRTRWDAVPLSEVIPKSYHSQISGLFSGSAETKGVPGDLKKWVTSGSFSLTEGSLQKVALLETIANFTRSPQFKHLALHEVSGNFTYGVEKTTIDHFLLESRGLLKVEGDFSVAASGELSGSFQVGVTPQTLKWLPGSQARVFVAEREGYLWADVRVGGTLDKPREDLTQRLVVAAGTEIFGAGNKVIDQSSDAAIQGVKGIIDKVLPLFP